jgi:hypothetical protein
MTKGQNNFPKTTIETMRLLNDYKVPARQQHAKDLGSNWVAFVQHSGGPALPIVDFNACTMKKGTLKVQLPQTPHAGVGLGCPEPHIDSCKEEHTLFLANNRWVMVQEEEEEGNP